MKSEDWYGVAIKATPLHYCENLEDALPFLANGYKGDEPCDGINPAIHSVDNIQLLEAFLKHGANPNAGLPQVSPLYTHTEPEFLKLLIEYGADVNSRDRFGRTPVHCCTSLESLKLLIANGATPNVLDGDGESPEDNFLDNDEGKAMKAYLKTVIMGNINMGHP